MRKIRSAQLYKALNLLFVFVLFTFTVVPGEKNVHAVYKNVYVQSVSDKKLIESGESLQSIAAVDSPYLVKDLTHNSGYRLGSFTELGDLLYFFAIKPLSPGCQTELWKSDGSESGTILVKRLSAIGGYCYNYYPMPEMVAVSDVLFFSFDDGVHGKELWKSNGTEAGTVMVKDIFSGELSSNPDQLTDIGGILYFEANDDMEENGHNELWKSDGTASGTVMIKNLQPRYLTEYNGMVYFDGYDGGSNAELWKSDGTGAGTVLIKEVNFGRPSSFSDLTVVDGVLYLSADASGWRHLWKSDGTVAGTAEVKSFVSDGHLLELTNFNEILFLRASHDSGLGEELYKSDGTDAGTVLVKDIHPTGDSSPRNLTVVGDALFFSASDGTHGDELWKTDGSESGTVLVKDINPDSESSNIDKLTAVASQLFFVADDGTDGSELWKSDGTQAGTDQVKDIVPGAESSQLEELTNLSGDLVFTSGHVSHLGELWLSNGTETGTVIVKTLYPDSADSFIYLMTDTGGLLYFRADDGTHGEELWKSDGTESGTKMVKDIHPGNEASIYNLEGIGNILYFSANDGVHGTELWRSDGSESGTWMVKDIWPGSQSSHIGRLTNVDGTLFFAALGDDDVYGLWKSDGTSEGTEFIAEIDYEMYERVVYKGELFFRASYNFWRSDGTAAGTYVVKDVRPYCMTVAGDTLYFAAIYGGAGSEELWKSDGTGTGTTYVKDIVPGNLGAMPYPNEWCELEAVGDQLFFVAGHYGHEGHGGEIWKTDGTESGTVLVKDINPGAGDACTPFEGCMLTNVGDTLFFAPFRAEYGRELWKSDGTEGGTVLVKDINPGTGGGFCSVLYAPRCLSAINGYGILYFNGNDGSHGLELMQSNGSAPGTDITHDIATGAYPSSPHNFVISGSHLYFLADDAAHGRELWAMWIGSMGSVSISGDQAGYTGSQYSFTANVAPSDAATPVTYEWQATGQGGETNSGGLSDSISFTWSTPGVKTITVTASNGVNSVSAEWSITIDVPDVPLASVGLTGAEAGQVGITYDFLAEVSPLDATTPVTYEWQATGQSNVTNVGGDSDTVSFSWGSLGEKTIAVTASNGINSVEAEMTIVIGEEDIALESLTLTGDAEGLIGGECAFTAEINPLGATTPITYEWQATDQSAVTHSGGISDTVTYFWDTPGIKVVSVTANNGMSELQEQVEILINVEDVMIYFPFLVSKPLP